MRKHMKNHKWRYVWEENRDKIMASSGILLGVGALAGVVVLMFGGDDFSYKETDVAEVILAENLLVKNSEGQMDLISVAENKSVDTYDLPANALLAKSANLDAMFVYDKDVGTLTKVFVEENVIQSEVVQTVKDSDIKTILAEATSFTTNDVAFAFATPTNTVFVPGAGEIWKSDEKLAKPDALAVTNEMLYIAKDEKVISYNLETKKQQSVDIGDTSLRLEEMNESVVVYNEFGSGIGQQMILRLEDGSLKIEELKQFDTLKPYSIDVPSDENQMIFLSDNEGSTTMTVWNAVGVDDEGATIKNSEATSVKLDTDIHYSKETALVSNGYLYNINALSQSLTILEIGTGREAKTITIEATDGDTFYIPVYAETK